MTRVKCSNNIPIQCSAYHRVRISLSFCLNTSSAQHKFNRNSYHQKYWIGLRYRTEAKRQPRASSSPLRRQIEWEKKNKKNGIKFHLILTNCWSIVTVKWHNQTENDDTTETEKKRANEWESGRTDGRSLPMALIWIKIKWSPCTAQALMRKVCILSVASVHMLNADNKIVTMQQNEGKSLLIQGNVLQTSSSSSSLMLLYMLFAPQNTHQMPKFVKHFHFSDLPTKENKNEEKKRKKQAGKLSTHFAKMKDAGKHDMYNSREKKKRDCRWECICQPTTNCSIDERYIFIFFRVHKNRIQCEIVKCYTSTATSTASQQQKKKDEMRLKWMISSKNTFEENI